MEPNLPTPSPAEQQVDKALYALGHEPAELRPETKILHKQQLLSLAEKLQTEGANTVKAMPRVEEVPRRTFMQTLRLILSGAGAGFAVGLCALLLFMNFRNGGSGSSGSIDALGRVLIPAAQANDTFQVYADPDTAKVADQSALIFKSKVALSPDQVQRTLRVDTGHVQDVERVSADTFRVHLAAVPSDKIVRVALAAVIQNGTSTEDVVPRDYSWAVQTTDALQLVSSLPANNAGAVPLDASLELVLNAQGFTNVTSSIEISPATEGRFQLNGRRIIFLPAQPWKASTLYRVTLKQGLTAENLALPEDVSFQFQTGDGLTDGTTVPSIRALSEFQEAYVGDVITVQLSRTPGIASVPTTTAVTGYRLTEDEAARFLAKRLPYSYAFGSGQHLSDYASIAKTEAFNMQLPITRPSERDSELVTLPKFTEQGWYVLRFTSGPAETWIFVQVTNIASYVIADKDQLLIWAVNIEGKQSLSSFPVHLENSETRFTDASGLVHLPTPSFLQAPATSTDPQVAIVHLGDVNSGLRALAVVGPTSNYNPFDRTAKGLERTWGYAYPDRPLYRSSDEMKVAGILQDRDRTSKIGQAELRLTKSSYVEDLVNGNDRVYASTALTLDEAGRYEATLSWKNIAPGFYQLDLVRDGQLVISRYVEVRAFEKPTYYLDVALSAKRVFANQPVQAHIKASFFSGAAVPNARLMVRTSQGEGAPIDQEVMLNETGELDLPLKVAPVACTARLADPCANTEQLLVSVYPVAGEQSQVLGSATLDVVGSELDVRGEVGEVNGRAELTLQTYRRDLQKTLDDVGATWPGRTLRGQYVGVRYEKIQDGVWYDAFEKKVVPYYRYERRQDPPVEFTVQTDANGQARYSFSMQTDRDFYDITIQGEDVAGRFNRFTTSAARGWYVEGATTATPHLDLQGKGDNREVTIGEILKPSLQMGTSTLDTTKGPGVLFLTLSRGIKQVVRTASANWETTFNEGLVPNATFRGVTFDGRKFISSDAVVFLKKEDRTIDVQVTSNKQTYKPGEKAMLRFELKPRAGQSIPTDVKVAYAVVDEALLSLSGVYQEDPLMWINNYVSDGVLFQRASHMDDWLFTGGGAEKGGGGVGDRGQGARRLFKDVAGTGLVTVNSQGATTVEIQLPDNLTSWRVTAVALGSDLKAGVGTMSVKTSKEVFIDAVVPMRALATDQSVLKLRAFGSGLRLGEPVNFTLDAPVLGLQNYAATGTAGEAIYIALPKTIPGTHVLTVGVAQGSFSDRMERTLEIVTTRVVHEELVTIEPSPGSGLPVLSSETTQLVVSARGKSTLYASLRELADSDSLRSDARVAASVAQDLLRSAYGETSQTAEDSLLDIQTAEEGGIHLLPYGSSEVPLSMQMALTSPERIDAWQLRSYLSDKLVHGVTRLERLQAMAGLAALRAPVVLDLQQAASLTDRTPEETLAIAEGLVAVGDTERAGRLMRELMSISKLRDGQRFVQIGTESSPETYEATAELAALAERLLLPEASQLNAFIQEHWSADVFPVLAKVRYLAFRLQHLPADDGSLQWTDGQRTETISLKETPLKTIILSPERLASFRVVSVSGPVVLSYLRPQSGLPAKSPTLALTRRYESTKPLDQLTEGDELTVVLTPQFAASALNGCALIQDDLPANVLPLSRTSLKDNEPLFFQSNAVSFVTCKGDQSPEISYRVKVMARGTYKAQPSIMQRLDTPSVATYSDEQTIVVR